MSARTEQHCPAPDGYRNSPAWAAAKGQEQNGQLWLHQSLALEYLENRQNVVTATGTASGKSLIFQLAAIRTILEDPDAAVIVFYPMKALSHDQMRRWRQAAEDVGLPPETINNLDGDVHHTLRARILNESRIVVATPDICHSWLLRLSAGRAQQNFLSRLAMIIVDESHAYESVLGSNSAYLMRRLVAAVVERRGHVPQFCASTATARNPAEHMQSLTGLPFVSVAENLNGSPRQERAIFHLPSERSYEERIQQVAELIHAILYASDDAQIIAFADSRQGVERIVAATGRHDVRAYRGGYLPEERRNIEDALRDSTIRAVVSTPALELGIDIPELNYGINLGLPNSRKRFHQRLGRIGRRKPGRFIIIENRYKLMQHGDSLREYCQQEVEPSRMYLENAYVQRQQAACLLRELSDRRRPPTPLPEKTEWPNGFDKVVHDLNQQHAVPHGGSPHGKYKLRMAGEHGELNLMVMDNNPPSKVGSITIEQAIREAYPGAIYRHDRRTYTVGGWRRPKTGNPYITIRETMPSQNSTRPLRRNCATVRLTPEGLIDGNMRILPHGMIAEVKCLINHSVEGYDLNDQTMLYGKSDDKNMTRKHYEHLTTGVILTIDEDWFSGYGQSDTRKEIASALRQHLCYRNATPVGDVAYMWQNIGLDTGESVTALENAILIYDDIPGGLRLSRDIYDSPDHYGRVLSISVIAEDSVDASLVSPFDANNFQHWLNSADPLALPGTTAPAPPQQPLLRILQANSRVAGHDGRTYTIDSYRVTLHPAGDPTVLYQCRDDDDNISNLMENDLTTLGQAWNWEIYDPVQSVATSLPNL